MMRLCYKEVVLKDGEGTLRTVKSRSLAAFFLELETFGNMVALQHTTYGIAPRLPVEIEEIIFVLTVKSCPSSWVTLVRVAKRVQTWMEPYQYQVLTDSNLSPGYDLKKHGGRVRSVLLRSLITAEARQTIECCPNVTNIALWLPCSPKGLLSNLPHRLPLTHLSGDIEALFESDWPPFELPILQDVTHLEVTGPLCDWQKWEGIDQLPELSHLSVAGEYSDHIILHLLESLPNLKALIVQSGAVRDFDPLNSPDIPSDARLTFRVITDSYNEWFASANGRESFWDRVETDRLVDFSD
ncbi:hypothetical protein BDN72DRAFT_965039 [Pluteus cervinus]|uniref:Uncharacterized protein n=1 Tax=Pluteus cervinus TaxID=181527 RepID=A0ACD3A7X3_9AGAR|nr:hypothetical protein BDN72DRAFT_965039 [Pluteus cervinus]